MSGNPAGLKASRLAIELGTELTMEAPRVAGRMKSRLIGLLPNEYLLVKPPPTESLGPLHSVYQEGDTLVLRYLFNGTVFGFRSLVMGAVTHPVKLLVLSHPSQVMEHDIRASRRLDCFIPSRVRIGDGEEVDGTIVDFSETGCQVVLLLDRLGEQAVQTGLGITARFRLPEEPADVALTGQIHRQGSDDQRLWLGVAFDERAEGPYRRLRNYLGPAP